MQLDAYYNEVENKIIATPTNNFFRWTMINMGLVKIKGVDVVLQGLWKFGNDWVFDSQLSYTYQKAQDFTDKSDKDTYGDKYRISPGIVARLY